MPICTRYPNKSKGIIHAMRNMLSAMKSIRNLIVDLLDLMVLIPAMLSASKKLLTIEVVVLSFKRVSDCMKVSGPANKRADAFGKHVFGSSHRVFSMCSVLVCQKWRKKLISSGLISLVGDPRAKFFSCSHKFFRKLFCFQCDKLIHYQF